MREEDAPLQGEWDGRPLSMSEPNRAMRTLLLLSLLGAACGTRPSAPVAPPIPRQPDFARYPVAERFRGTPAAPDLSSAADARRFRTVLRSGARSGPNFAGHYTVVTWGCGTSCQSHAIVDARSGKVTFIPFPTTLGLAYRLDSRLLVVDPSTECIPADEWGPEFSVWLVWTGTELQTVDSVRIQSPCGEPPVAP